MITNEENMSNALTTLTRTLATKLDMGDGADLIGTLKATAFKGDVSDAQMTALLVVANQYALNPWTKEIYAFPDKNNGIVPVVGVDGWSRIINSHPQFDGIDFEQDSESCTCIIYRKDRSHPIKVTEWMAECKRGTGPWQSHPRRMLRHKSMIQCARLAFGYGGIYDQDEAERIVDATEKHMGPAEIVQPAAPTVWPADKWAETLPKMIHGIRNGKTVEGALAWLRAKAEVTQAQETELREAAKALETKAAPTSAADAPKVDFDKLAADMRAAPDKDSLYAAASILDAVTDEAQRMRLNEIFDACVAQLEEA